MSLRSLLNRDRLTSVSAKRVARASMACLDRLQNEPKEVQIAAMACSFTLLARHLGMHAGDALDVAARILSDKQRKTDLQAVSLYIENELK